MIGAEAARLFRDQVTPDLHKASEAGVWPEELWHRVEQMGLTDVLLLDPADEPWQQCHSILQEAGRHALPLPLAETMLMRFCLQAFAPPSTHPTRPTQQLPQPGGPATILTLAQSRGWQRASNVILHETGTDTWISGEWRQVAFARHCNWAIVEVPISEQLVPGLVQLQGTRSAQVEIERYMAISGEPRDTVRLTRAPVWLLTGGDISSVRLQGRLAWMRASMMSGAIEALLEASVEYANFRQQFGKPIGRFQAIQHALAQLAGEAACASMAAGSSAMAMSEPETFGIACAKIRCGEAAGVAAAIAHQVHGAIGFTREHSLHNLTRRLWTWRAEYGNESYWAAELGRQAITAASMTDGVWAWMTSR